MHLQVPWDSRVGGIEEAAEFDRPVPSVAFANDRPRLDIERGKQRRRPMPNVIVRPSFCLPGPQRQDGALRSSA